jgi:hypothetical protein
LRECPGLWGGKDWPYEAYNPKTGLVYIPSNENQTAFMSACISMTSTSDGERDKNTLLHLTPITMRPLAKVAKK